MTQQSYRHVINEGLWNNNPALVQILGFNGRSLSNPDKKGWAVKRDGGIFDQFTGATISPRAVVNAVHRSLLYYSEHRDELFDKPSMPLEGQPS